MKTETRVAIIGAAATILAALIGVIGAKTRSDRDAAPPAAQHRAIDQAAALSQSLSFSHIRVVLHVKVGDSPALAAQLKPKLTDAGYDVPEIRLVDRVPAHTQVRYFRKSEQREAEELAKLLRGWGVTDVKPAPITAANARPNQFEIWFVPR
jgi:hypothetical protein